MRTSRALLLAAVTASGLLLAGCGSLGSNVNTTAANTTSTSTAAAKASGAAAASKPAGLGDTIDVTDASGVKLAVTLTKVDAAAASTDQFSAPSAGNQYFAAQFKILNLASAAWSDSASNCVVVKDGKSQTFQSTIVTAISSGPLMADTANIASGDSTLGWVVFEVPKGDRVATVQFTPLSGMGSDTAQWKIG